MRVPKTRADEIELDIILPAKTIVEKAWNLLRPGLGSELLATLPEDFLLAEIDNERSLQAFVRNLTAVQKGHLQLPFDRFLALHEVIQARLIRQFHSHLAR
jgi:hypothetical protein